MYKLTTLEEAFSSINPGEPLAFDLETDGKYGKICLAQFYQKSWTHVLAVHNPQPIILMAYLSKLTPNTTIVAHNASYDISTVQRQTSTRWIPHSFEDTLLMARIHWPAADEYSLDACMARTLGYDPYVQAGINKKEMQKAKWNVAHIPPKQLEYGAIDVYHLLDVYEECLPAKQTFSYKLDMTSLEEALDWQNNGMLVDKERLQAMYQSNLKRIAEVAVPINVNSWQQVRPYIGEDESDALALMTFWLRDGNERARNVNEVRKLRKLNSFLDKFDTDDGMIYGVFGPYARSGRYTCSEQNLQQLPRKTKGLFTSERYMLYSDFSQLELRSIAAITGDHRMCEVYYNDGDIHNLVNEMLNIIRQIAKTINFNGLYGGGVGMMRSILIKDAEILMPEPEVASALRRWKQLFYGVAQWQERGIRDHRAGRLGSTACGRKYRGRLMTDQLNIENQGTGAEVAKLAKHYMYPDFLANDCKLMNFIHDSYIVDTPKDEAIICEVSKRMAEAMQEAWVEVTKQCKVTDIPMPVTVLGGTHWGDIEAGKYDYKYEVK